ncbi:MAG TPA: hypothetical protein VL574_05130 [Stellaceae bacterium]|jgi:hypothetical protein|nr:hypothetical protein [Stellaceae bacterium]
MSIQFGPQGYGQPPYEPPTAPAVQAAMQIPVEPQPTLEVVETPAHDGSGTSKDDTDRDGDGGRAFDPNGKRRGLLLDIRS